MISTLLFIVNLAGSIAPLHNPNNDYYYQSAKHLTQVTNKDDLIITGQHHLFSAYIKRYVGCNHVCLDLVYEHTGSDEDFTKEIRDIINSNLHHDKRVLISRDAIRLAADNYIIAVKGTSDANYLVMEIWKNYEVFWDWTENRDFAFYVLNPDVVHDELF